MIHRTDDERVRSIVRNVLGSWLVWLFATRTFKLLPHLWKRPQDIIHVPAFILFGYYFAIMKLYALFTLHEVCASRLSLCFRTLTRVRT